jgi:hypothetical protein
MPRGQRDQPGLSEAPPEKVLANSQDYLGQTPLMFSIPRSRCSQISAEFAFDGCQYYRSGGLPDRVRSIIDDFQIANSWSSREISNAGGRVAATGITSHL